MKRILTLACLVLFLGQLQAQERPQAHARGRSAPKNLQGMQALSNIKHAEMLKALPRADEQEWDSRKLGIVPPVKNQAQCGSCWNFSGIGVIEIAACLARLTPNDGSKGFSEQYILDCAQNGGCNGDDNTSVLMHAKATGVPFASDYGPYQAQAGRCRYNSSMKLTKLVDWGFADPNAGQNYNVITDAQLIKNAIKAFGCVGCAVAAGPSWDGYQAGQEHWGSSNQIDHDVIIVGWKPSKQRPSQYVWIMRNSWSDQWGDKGYMDIGIGADSIGTEAVWGRFDVSPTPPTPPVPPTPPIVVTGGTFTGTGSVKIFGISEPITITGTYTPNATQTKEPPCCGKQAVPAVVCTLLDEFAKLAPGLLIEVDLLKIVLGCSPGPVEGKAQAKAALAASARQAPARGLLLCGLLTTLANLDPALAPVLNELKALLGCK